MLPLSTQSGYKRATRDAFFLALEVILEKEKRRKGSLVEEAVESVLVCNPCIITTNMLPV
jgi:hypothetical protein